MSSSPPLFLGVAGALGRMGRAVAAQAEGRPGLEVGVLFDRADQAGTPIGETRLRTAVEAMAACGVIVDFSSAEASSALAEAAAAAGGPALVIGSTGFNDEQTARVAKAAERIAIVKSGNFSLGVNVLLGLVERAAEALKAQDYDIEVFEAHHRRKVDAPSGTGLMLGEAAARGRSIDLAQMAVRVRDGLTGARPEGTVGFSVMRGGGIVGEHSVVFAAEDEILTLSHSARDRSLFARGALEAAAWAAGKPPGLYDMLDVLGFRG
jgi:4-hydroxy-tetrahydrodipicolinate reductase